MQDTDPVASLPITKTPKCYVGGAFIRSESGRVYPVQDASGDFFANIPQCTRKDLRNAVEAAAKAGPGWAKRTAYNRGQILYRLAEMMQPRSAELIEALMLHGISRADADREVSTTLDRLIHYAGWTDKYEQVLSSVNPVASPHFNFTVTEPLGIVGVLAPEDYPLLAMVSLIAPAITSGNTVVALASCSKPYPAILLGEMMATSDLPGGVVNVLTGLRKEIMPTMATHAHLRAIAGVTDGDEAKVIQLGAAESMKRIRLRKPTDWFADETAGLDEIRAFVEFKTTWHPIGA